MTLTQKTFIPLIFLSILLIKLSWLSLAKAADIPTVLHHPRSSASFFISGHSLTDNPYGDYLIQIIKSFGMKSEYNQQIVIGSPIRVRTRGMDPNSRVFQGYKIGKNREGSGLSILDELNYRRTIQLKQYNYLIITERHDLIDVVIWEGTDKYLRHYRDRFMMNNNGRVYFFAPWLGRNNLKDIKAWIEYEESALKAWECVVSKVNHDLIREQLPPVSIIPANVALVELVGRLLSGSLSEELGNRPDFDRLTLLFSDDVHLTKLGIYYIALVTFASIFDSSPQGVWFPQDISQKAASYLQNLSWEFVSNKGINTPIKNLMRCATFFTESFCEVYGIYSNKLQHMQSCRNHFAYQNKSSLFYSGEK
jgi:hypothetical protein